MWCAEKAWASLAAQMPYFLGKLENVQMSECYQKRRGEVLYIISKIAVESQPCFSQLAPKSLLAIYCAMDCCMLARDKQVYSMLLPAEYMKFLQTLFL